MDVFETFSRGAGTLLDISRELRDLCVVLDGSLEKLIKIAEKAINVSGEFVDTMDKLTDIKVTDDSEYNTEPS